MILHDYWRSSAAYRVRIALALKGIEPGRRYVHLRKGEQRAPGHLAKHPLGLVPVLEDGATTLTQSLAILEYLEETHPRPPLLPAKPAERAWVRAVALAVACEIHPLNNLRVLNYLTQELGVSGAQKDAWYAHWVALGLRAVEDVLARSGDTGRFCHGDAPGLADCCLVPQVFNARRFNCALDAYPTIARIVDACEQLPAFRQAAPDMQPDAERAPAR